jgi:hypothetical protein
MGELYKALMDASGNASFPEMYLREKAKYEDIEKRYNMLVSLLKEEGCARVSRKIDDELKAQKRIL